MVLWWRGTYHGHVSFSSQWVVLVSGEYLFSFLHFSRQRTFYSFYPFTFLLRLTFLTSIFFSLYLISLSLLLLRRTSLHPIRFSSLFSGTFALSCAFSFSGYIVLFSSAFFLFGFMYFSWMVGYAKFRSISPSIAFLFACLGGLLDSSGDRYPQIGGFIVGDSGLNLALGDLYPLLHRSLSWFKSVHGVLRREIMGSKLGTSGQERGSSSGVAADGTIRDTATSVPPSSSILPSTPTSTCPFHAL